MDTMTSVHLSSSVQAGREAREETNNPQESIRSDSRETQVSMRN